MDEARRSRHLALERMEKAARRLKQENPGTQSSQILSLTMVELAEKLKEGSLSPESVLYSYMDKALEVNWEVNCVTDFIHGCEDQLQKLEKQKEKGLLYGIPISIKDHMNCKQRRRCGSQTEIPVQYLQASCSGEKDLGHHSETHIPTHCSGSRRSLWSGVRHPGVALEKGNEPACAHVPMQAYRMEFITKWRQLRLDVMLCLMLGPAFNHGYAGKLVAATSYTHLYNVLDFPAGVVPVSAVMRADEEELKQYRGHHRDPWDKRLREAVSGAVGLPVALPWQEELCLRFMRDVEALARGAKRSVSFLGASLVTDIFYEKSFH